MRRAPQLGQTNLRFATFLGDDDWTRQLNVNEPSFTSTSMVSPGAKPPDRIFELLLDRGNGLDLLALQRVEHHDLVHAVDELGPEMLADHFHHRGLHRLVVLARAFLDACRAQV
jgi:hypothetical protein